MASFVIVTDLSKRQLKISTSPSKQLTEILQEACKRAQVDPALHALRHGKQLLDLSLTMRFAGLSAGAKLDLVRASSKVSQVMIALDVAGAPRLKASCLASDTLWEVLSTFEAQGVQLRARPSSKDATRRAQPVLMINNRPFETDEALQGTTLAALGLQQGSAAIKASFRDTDEPLPAGIAMPAAPIVEPVTKANPIQVSQEPAIEPGSTTEAKREPVTPSDRHPILLLPSKDAPPVFAASPDDDSHTPSLDQARRYLSLLQQPNKASQEPLMTRAQREAKEAHMQAYKQATPSVLKFKFRFPVNVAGGLQALAEFGAQEDTAALYDFVSGLLEEGGGLAFQLETGYPDRRCLARYAPGTLQGLGFGAATALQVVTVGETALKVKPSVMAHAVEARIHLEKQREEERAQEKEDEQHAIAASQSKPTIDDHPTDSKGKKIPKWLKMGKR